MDYSILVLLALLVLVVGVTAGVKYLKKKDIVEADDVTAAINVLGITLNIADELKLREDKKIRAISDVIVLTTNYVKQSLTVITKAQALEYAKALCDQFDVELTTARVEILSKLLDLALVKYEKGESVPVESNVSDMFEPTEKKSDTVEIKFTEK